MDILNLQELTAVDVAETDTAYIITVTENPATIACSHCGTMGEYQLFGKRECLITDIPIKSKPVKLKVLRQRYRCKSCGGLFIATISDLDQKRNCTNRLIEFIKKQYGTSSVRKIASSAGVNSALAQRILQDYEEQIW